MVLIAEADDPSGKHVRALACWYDGAFIEEPFEYDTAGQPCAVITEYPWVSFPEALTERFPDDTPAVQLGLESYLAVCLRSSDERAPRPHRRARRTPDGGDEEDVAALRSSPPAPPRSSSAATRRARSRRRARG